MSTVHDIPGGTLEVLQDGTKIQKSNGVSLVVKPDGTKIQVQPDGSRLTLNPDGSRYQENADGSTLHLGPNGTQTQTRANGMILEIFTDGTKRQTDQYGIVVDVAENGDKIQHNLDGTKSERRGQRAFKHLADGSILEVNPTTGNIIAVERTAKSPEAEALVAQNEANKKDSVEELKKVYNPNITRHMDEKSGAWYEYDKISLETRWLTTEQTEEQLRTDELSQAIATAREAEQKILAIESKSKETLEEMQSQLATTTQRNVDLQEQVLVLQADVQRRHDAHVASHKQYEAHLELTVSQLTKTSTEDSVGGDELRNLQEKYRTLQNEYEKTTGELATTKGTLNAATKRLENVRRTLTNTRKDLSTSTEATRKLTRKYDEVVDRAGLIAEEMQGMQIVLDNSADTYAQSIHDISRLEANLEKVNQERDEAVSKITKITSTTTTAEDTAEDKRTDRLLLAAERMCEVTMKKLNNAQKEIRQQRTRVEEMELRRESGDVMMRRQRNALKEAQELIESLRHELQTLSEIHERNSSAAKEHTEALKDKLFELYEKYKSVDTTSTGQNSSEQKEKENALAETAKTQSEQIYNLNDQINQKDMTITKLRNEISSLHSKINSRKPKERESVVAMSAMSFFDMDNLGLEEQVGEQTPPPPQNSQRARVGSRARAYSRASRNRDNRKYSSSGNSNRFSFSRSSSGLGGSLGSSLVLDQDNVDRILLMREESREQRTNALEGLLSVSEGKKE